MLYIHAILLFLNYHFQCSHKGVKCAALVYFAHETVRCTCIFLIYPGIDSSIIVVLEVSKLQLSTRVPVCLGDKSPDKGGKEGGKEDMKKKEKVD